MSRLRPPAPKHFWSQLTEYDRALHAGAKEAERGLLTTRSRGSWQYIEDQQLFDDEPPVSSQAVVMSWKGARVAGGLLRMEGTLSVMRTHIDHEIYTPGESPVPATDTRYLYTDVPFMGNSGKSIYKIVKGVVDLKSPDQDAPNPLGPTTLEALKQAAAAGLWDLETSDYAYVLAEMDRGASGEFNEMPTAVEPPEEWFDN